MPTYESEDKIKGHLGSGRNSIVLKKLVILKGITVLEENKHRKVEILRPVIPIRCDIRKHFDLIHNCYDTMGGPTLRGKVTYLQPKVR